MSRWLDLGSHDRYVLRCLECPWQREVAADRCDETARLHEVTKHHGRATAWRTYVGRSRDGD